MTACVACTSCGSANTTKYISQYKQKKNSCFYSREHNIYEHEDNYKTIRQYNIYTSHKHNSYDP